MGKLKEFFKRHKVNREKNYVNQFVAEVNSLAQMEQVEHRRCIIVHSFSDKPIPIQVFLTMVAVSCLGAGGISYALKTSLYDEKMFLMCIGGALLCMIGVAIDKAIPFKPKYTPISEEKHQEWLNECER